MSGESYLQHLRAKFQYSGSLRLLLDGLDRLGLEINPYYLMSEDCEARIEPPGEKEYRVVQFGRRDMPLLAELPIRTRGLRKLNQLVDDGKRCLALMDGDRLAAFCWYDLDECNYTGCRFDLDSDAAYLFDAYTLPAYRGAGLAPHLRSVLYSELVGIGRHRLFSVSSCFNAPALRFKAKLGARVLHLGITVKIFGRLSVARVLKRYPVPGTRAP